MPPRWRHAGSAALLLWLLLLLLVPQARAAETTVLELRAATVTSTVDGVTRSESLALPYHWDRRHGGRPGQATLELSFSLPAAPAVPWGIYLPRVGNRFELRVNGTLLQVSGDLARGNSADYAKAPIFIAVPGALLRAGDNRITVRIGADSGRRAGLSPLTVGPAALLRGSGYFASAYAWRFTGSVLLCAFSILVGGIALALWLTQVDNIAADGARREGIYLWAALAEFCWALRVGDAVVPQPPLPWAAWGTLMTACFSGWAASAVMFCHHVAGWQRHASYRWMRWAVSGVFTVPVVVTWFALSAARPQWLTYWLAIEIALLLLFVSGFVWAAWRRPNAARILVVAVVLATVAAGVRDWFVIRVSDAYGDTTWVRYVSVFFGLALLAILVMRFRSVSTQARELLATLASRLAQREAELADIYRQLEQVAREQARKQERERILADMHDGVGAHLSSAIRQLQSGRAEPGELLATLRDSLDQLKLSIDAVRLPPGDVGALLATLRYRLEPRFAPLGLAFDWAVDELPPLARLDEQAMRLLQYLLFEAISNVLQHAHASVLRIEAAMHGPVLRLALIDNGRGFDASRPPRALAERAQALGARLAVESRAGRTAVTLEFDANAK